MPATHVTDWQERLLGRLAQQFRGKAKIEAVVSAIAAQAQEIENALYDTLTLHGIDSATGDTLDVVGRIVGRERGGLSDAVYRLYLKGQIRANRSSGTPADILEVFAIVFPGASLSLAEIDFPAGFLLVAFDTDGFTTDELAAAVSFLRRIRAAAIRATIVYSTTDLAHTFTLGDESLYPETSWDLGHSDAADPTRGGGLLAGAVEV